jgi:tetratricopeptide (TPR) repeat protein
MMEDLEETIRQKEINLRRRNTRGIRGVLLADLAEAHFELYRHGKLQSLDEAINNLREALDFTNEDRFRGLLTQYLLERRQDYDVDEAITISRANVESAKGYWLALLARGLIQKYGRTGNLSLLNEAIQNARISFDMGSGDHEASKSRSLTLAEGLRERFLRIRDKKDIDEAIRVVETVVVSTPMDSADPGDPLHKLAILLLERYEHNKLRSELQLEEAIKTAQEAVDVTPESYPPELAARLNTLAIAQSFRQDMTQEALTEMLMNAKRAVDIIPEGHPDRDDLLDALASCYSDRYGQTKNEDDRCAAINLLEIVSRSTKVMPVNRVKVARQAIKLRLLKDEFAEANTLAEEALDLLPTVCSRYLSRADQQYAVTQVSGLAADACSLLLKANNYHPARAVEYLEHGRGLIIGYLIDGRGDISDLRKKYPQKANEFGKIRSKTFTPSKHGESLNSRLRDLEDLEEMMADLEGCLRDIRKLPGYDRFLLPPLSDELVQDSNEGPIIIVNVTSISSDALIVRPCKVEPVKHIQLPNFGAEQVERYRQWSLVRGARDAGEEKGTQQDKRYLGFLGQLWGECVRLVLDELGFLSTASSAELPRVWWIGTGMASSLPFHAAGIHSDNSEECAFNHVISSYTPSIKALRHAREKAVMKSKSQSLLLVTMRTTPGMNSLPGVDEEEQKIMSAIKAPHSVRLLPQPDSKAVLHGLRNHNIAHFACHGSSDLVDPSNSFLALAGKSSTVDRLTVQKVSDSRLRRSWLAYLSACSTAQNKVPELADETLHLAAGFQVAGFAHTIASMWPSNDDVCAQIAAIFYDALLTKGGIKEGNTAPAKALHTAVKRVRSQYIQQPSLWAQYIHMGA